MEAGRASLPAGEKEKKERKQLALLTAAITFMVAMFNSSAG